MAVPIPVKTNLIPSTNKLNIPVTDEILFINPCIALIIFGKLVIAQPIIRIPMKSNILPRKPLVLFAKIFPCVFGTPCTEEASNSSSLAFLFIFSCLCLKYLLSLRIEFLLKIFLCLIVFMVSSEFLLAATNPSEKLCNESPIDLILIEDLKSEFLLFCIDIMR